MFSFFSEKRWNFLHTKKEKNKSHVKNALERRFATLPKWILELKN
jgi:hypothetical protein